MKNTGFTPDTRQIVNTRSGGRCEKCGLKPAIQQHHRQNRGRLGPREGLNEASNALDLCLGCHDWIGRNIAKSRDYGWAVSFYQDPAQVPVHLWDGVFLLGPDGSKAPTSPL